MAAELPKLKLLYFDIHGLAARIRLACRYAGLPLEDVRFGSREEFTAMKASGALPFGQVPLLLVRDSRSNEETALAQSAAILRYVCRLGGLHPSEALRAALVDSALDAESDAFAAYRAVKYRERSGLSHIDEVTLASATSALNADVVPRHLAQLEALLEKSGSGWVAGTEGPSAADFAWGTQLRELREGKLVWLDPALVTRRPRCAAFLDKFLALPQVAAYYAERP